MAIDSDTNADGKNGRNPSVYSDFEWLFRPALRGHGLSFQRVGGECAGFAQRGVERRYDHAPRRKI